MPYVWSFVDGPTQYVLPYGPKTVDYIIVSGAMRKKYNITKVPLTGEMPDVLTHIEEYPTYTLYWPLVTSALFAKLSPLPMHKTIVFTDGVENVQFNVQINGKAFNNLKTINNGEVIRSAAITFRLIVG